MYSISRLRNFSKSLNISKPLKIKKKINENFDTTNASSLYRFTKLASEKLIREIFFNTKLKYIINRFGVNKSNFRSAIFLYYLFLEVIGPLKCPNLDIEV